MFYVCVFDENSQYQFTVDDFNHQAPAAIVVLDHTPLRLFDLNHPNVYSISF